MSACCRVCYRSTEFPPPELDPPPVPPAGAGLGVADGVALGVAGAGVEVVPVVSLGRGCVSLLSQAEIATAAALKQINSLTFICDVPEVQFRLTAYRVLPVPPVAGRVLAPLVPVPVPAPEVPVPPVPVPVSLPLAPVPVPVPPPGKVLSTFWGALLTWPLGVSICPSLMVIVRPSGMVTLPVGSTFVPFWSVVLLVIGCGRPRCIWYSLPFALITVFSIAAVAAAPTPPVPVPPRVLDPVPVPPVVVLVLPVPALVLPVPVVPPADVLLLPVPEVPAEELPAVCARVVVVARAMAKAELAMVYWIVFFMAQRDRVIKLATDLRYMPR